MLIEKHRLNAVECIWRIQSGVCGNSGVRGVSDDEESEQGTGGGSGGGGAAERADWSAFGRCRPSHWSGKKQRKGETESGCEREIK
jgi:hypothetical protein